MQIRPFREGDIEALRVLWRTTWCDTYASRCGVGVYAAIEACLDGDAVRSMFAEDGGCVIAIEAEEIVGSLCFAERGATAYAWGMYVRPARKRSGIGHALMAHAARSFRNAEWIDLSAVDERALSFYRKLGFAEQGAGEVELLPGFRVPTTRLRAAVRDTRLMPGSAP